MTKVGSGYLWVVNSNDFHYDLPEEAIAKHPAEPRRAARMAILGRDGTLSHQTFEDLPEALRREGVDGLWANDTKVLHARILASKATGGQLEIFLLAPLSLPVEESLLAREEVRWTAMVRNAKRWSDGRATAEGRDHVLNVERLSDAFDGTRVVRLTWQAKDSGHANATFGEVLEDLGKTPLPPYMRRPAQDQDRTDYQTVFAMTPGSVAAPTAGLHYDAPLLSALAAANCPLHRITLHVGAGTFKPLTEGKVADHDMHAERCVMSREALVTMASQHVRVATGTTTLRTMESMYWWSLHHRVHGSWPEVLPQRSPYGALAAESEALSWSDRDALNHILEFASWDERDEVTFETQLMIVPGYTIRMVQGLVTNFHQPGSTLLCLVGAFVGMEAWKAMYADCLEQGYRFLSYGDGSLLWLPQE